LRGKCKRFIREWSREDVVEVDIYNQIKIVILYMFTSGAYNGRESTIKRALDGSIYPG
jgi:hypothetical protein